MESHPVRTAAIFVWSPCRRGPTCPYLRRRRCLFFHSEDEIASASEVGQDQPTVVSMMARMARLEQAVSLFIGVPVPQIMEDLVDGVQAVPQELLPNLLGERSGAVPLPQTKENVVERTQLAPHVHERVVESLDQPGDQARRDSADAVYPREQPGDHTCRDSADAVHRHGRRDVPGNQECRASADAVHRQGCRRAFGDTATGHSDTDVFEDCESPAGAVHQPSSGHACCEAAIGPSVSNCAEDGGSPAGAVHRQIRGRAVDQPGDQARLDATEYVRRHGCRHACCDAPTGPSGSDCAGDCGRPAGAVHRPRERTCDHTGDQACRDSADSAHRQGRRQRVVGQIDDVPVPQILNEIVEAIPASHERVQQRTVKHRTVEQTGDEPTPQILEEIVEAVSAPHERVQQRTVEHVATVKNVSQERIPEGIGVQIDDDTVPVDQPGNQVRRDPQACGVATTGPSASNCGEDVGSLARAVRQQSRESTCDHADQPGDQARRSLTDSAHDQGASRANGRGPSKRRTKAEYEAMLKVEAKLGIRPSMLTPFDKWIKAAE